jgi:hypothetical protein
VPEPKLNEMTPFAKRVEEISDRLRVLVSELKTTAYNHDRLVRYEDRGLVSVSVSFGFKGLSTPIVLQVRDGAKQEELLATFKKVFLDEADALQAKIDSLKEEI